MIRPLPTFLLLATVTACASPARDPASPTPAPAPTPSATGLQAAADPLPWVPESFVAPFAPPRQAGAMPLPYCEGARQFLVQPGQVWQHLVAEIRPGDEVVLPAGVHAPQVIVGLRGTLARPIYIRSRDPVQAAFQAAAPGLVLRDAEHVVVENLLFLNPVDAAITVDSSVTGAARPASVEIRHCSIRGTRGDGSQDAVRLRDVSGARVTAVSVEDWDDAAVEIESCVGVRVSRLMTSGEGKAARRRGVAVGSGSQDVLVAESAINGDARVGIEIGGGPRAVGGATQPPRGIRIKGVVINLPGTAIRVLEGDGILVGRCTFHEPSDAMFDLAATGPIGRVRIEGCLGDWVPGGLRTFSPHPAALDPASVTLAENLWYSRELPEAWSAIGEPFGTRQHPQRTDIDPDLDRTSLRPRNPAAAGFGVFDPGTGPVPGR